MSTEGSESHRKVFRDPIHGYIELHPLLVKIIDTPQFQRLRHIKQLGAKYYVYPGAPHNRFEHSIGVCHLGGEMVKKLNEKQPGLITSKEVLCVKIAGLCHDLGHGPFSHVFDECFIPAAKRRRELHPDLYPSGIDLDWEYEDASVEMFDHMVKSNGLEEEFEKVELGDDEQKFIKELIHPKKEKEPSERSSWWKRKEKHFLYEIVANEENGIDVDKWDYFERDCYYMGVPNNFDMRRTMNLARVIKVEGKTHICIQHKDSFNLYQMFHTRYCLYKRAYKHPAANGVELMISDALVEAHEGGYRIRFRDEKPVSLLEAIHNMKAYTRLTDHVVHDIMMSPDQKLRPAQEILERIEKRQLYKCVVDKLVPEPSHDFKKHGDEIAKEIIEIAGPDLEDGDIKVQVVTIDYGKEERNPIDFVWFYTKEHPDKATRLDKNKITLLLPGNFMDKRIRVYSTKVGDEEARTKIKKHFDMWSQQSLGEQTKLTTKATNAVDNTRTSSGYLKGAEVVAQKSFPLTLQAHSFKWREYGFMLHVPEGSLPPEMTQTTVDIRVSLSGQFEFPEDSDLVSATYWLSCPHKFVKPLDVEFQHCAAITDPSHCSQLSFVITKCTQKELPYKFKELEGGTFSQHSSYGRISLTHFSGVAVVKTKSKGLRKGPRKISTAQQPKPPEIQEGREALKYTSVGASSEEVQVVEGLKYCAQLYTSRRPNHWRVQFVITKDLEAYLTFVQRTHAARDISFRIDFEDAKISLDIPSSGLTLDSGWKITPLFHPTIKKADVDGFTPGRMIPECALVLHWTKSRSLLHRIPLLGAKERDYFMLQIEDLETNVFDGSISELSSPSGSVSSTPPQTGQVDRPGVMVYLKKISNTQDLLMVGESLGLDGNELKKNLNSDTFLFDLVGDWLGRKHRVDEVGTPTWRGLVQALEYVGQSGLANDIKKNLRKLCS